MSWPPPGAERAAGEGLPPGLFDATCDVCPWQIGPIIGADAALIEVALHHLKEHPDVPYGMNLAYRPDLLAVARRRLAGRRPV